MNIEEGSTAALLVVDTALWMMKRHICEEREEEGQGVGATVLLVSLCGGGARCCLVFVGKGKGKGKGKRERERKGESAWRMKGEQYGGMSMDIGKRRRGEGERVRDRESQ